MPTQHPLSYLEAILVIGIGGFAGANLRYLVDSLVASSLLSTLTVNVVGCIALGFFLYNGAVSGMVSDRSQLVLATGFISSFTTYSTFVLDAVLAAPLVGLGYFSASYALGFVGVFIGRYVAAMVVRYTPPRPAQSGGDQ